MSIFCKYSTAAPSPTASAAGGVPASNFLGAFVKVDFCIETVSIIDPPLMKGGIISNNSSVAANNPIPNGPNIL